MFQASRRIYYLFSIITILLIATDSYCITVQKDGVITPIKINDKRVSFYQADGSLTVLDLYTGKVLERGSEVIQVDEDINKNRECYSLSNPIKRGKTNFYFMDLKNKDLKIYSTQCLPVYLRNNTEKKKWVGLLPYTANICRSSTIYIPGNVHV